MQSCSQTQISLPSSIFHPHCCLNLNTKSLSAPFLTAVVKYNQLKCVSPLGLWKLNLCGCKRITNITLVHAVNLRELRYLDLSFCQGVGGYFFSMTFFILYAYLSRTHKMYNYKETAHFFHPCIHMFLIFACLICIFCTCFHHRQGRRGCRLWLTIAPALKY